MDEPPSSPVRAGRALLALLGTEGPPLELQLLGRSLLHAALVGVAAGLCGAAFFAGLEYTQRFLLEVLAGYRFLRAHGETFHVSEKVHTFRPWLVALLPAVGGLLAGLVIRLAPETGGGGGDQMIHAFHHQGGVIRRRVIWIKAIASILTLGTGGAGGREGPTMQIGGALGSTVGRILGVTARERRILMVAGVAAGIAAVFRTPLGAALLAVEVLYRDDFESDALIPAVLASVTAYSVVISIFGETTMFAHAPRYPFHAEHLPLYGLLAVLLALLAARFASLLRAVHTFSQKLKVPAWTRPGIGGLALGVFTVLVLLYFNWRIGIPGQGLGLLGGGYGAAQMSINGMPWMPSGWRAVELLLLLCGAKLFASALTIGSGGSAGDFAPSLVLGGIFGGAFGRAAQLLFNDPSIDPGAFALVGMGTFYGGIAHVPLSALILVSELAGSYDLLVPLMLSGGIAFIILRKRSLYEAQLPTRHDSPVHRSSLLPELVRTIRVKEVMVANRPFTSFVTTTPAREIIAHVGDESWQDIFPVLDPEGVLIGIIPADAIRFLASLEEGAAWTIAADLMHPPVSVAADDDLRHAARLMLANGLREVPVVDEDQKIVGFLDEAEATKAYVDATTSTSEPR